MQFTDISALSRSFKSKSHTIRKLPGVTSLIFFTCHVTDLNTISIDLREHKNMKNTEKCFVQLWHPKNTFIVFFKITYNLYEWNEDEK